MLAGRACLRADRWYEGRQKWEQLFHTVTEMARLVRSTQACIRVSAP